jgi:predicted nucleotidyltransferase
VPKITRKTHLQSLLNRVVRRIVRRFHPEKVILFGSQARGDARPDSDLDLLVVMDFKGSKLDKMVELDETVDDIPMPVDILVTTPEDFAWRKDIVGTIEWPALHEGRVVFANRARSAVRPAGATAQVSGATRCQSMPKTPVPVPSLSP